MTHQRTGRGRVEHVISNIPDVPGLERARAAGAETTVIPHRSFESREAFDAELIKTVLATGPDLVILAGFMRILTPIFIEPLVGRILNIHPSLLPEFPGLNTHVGPLTQAAKFTAPPYIS